MDPKQFTSAVWDGDLAAVEAMLAAGADPNAPEAEGFEPPLHLAIEQQHLAVVRRLIAAGAALDVGGGSWTPLAHAIDIESDAASQRHWEPFRPSTELTELLLAAGAVPDGEAFAVARQYGNRKALELLERASPDEPRGT